MNMITEAELAEAWKVTRVFLRLSRMRGKGPAFVKIGRAVRYPVDAVDSFVKANMRGGV